MQVQMKCLFWTIASQFNDPGMNTLYKAIMDKVVEKQVLT
jgi:methylmalonyl-CoA mutase